LIEPFSKLIGSIFAACEIKIKGRTATFFSRQGGRNPACWKQKNPVGEKTPSYSPRAIRKIPVGKNSPLYLPITIYLDIDKRFR